VNCKDFSLPYIIQTIPIAVLEIVMLTVPASLSQAFEAQLSPRNMPNGQRRDFHNWPRFYPDFYAKYTFDPKRLFGNPDFRIHSLGILLLVDLMMPQKSGKNVIRAI
jgi:hypothetical protein